MKIHEILKKYWHYDSFRPLQEEIINSVLEGHDTLGLMPTGGGKSITFQVPALMYEKGVTIVVTPLVSLMKDQVDNLRRRRIKAVYFHSGMKAAEVRRAWEMILNASARFIYIAPERLANDRFMLELRHLDVNLIVVDEAHCISQWGYDFRPSYLNICKLRDIKPDVPVLALTATATPKVSDDIKRQLRFREGCLSFSKSFARNNISYIVRRADTKIHDVLHIITRTSGSAIVYVRSRKKCREISDFLSSADVSSTYYHAGLDFSVKEKHQNDWQNGNVRVIVATNAFGMGIDKPDVRVVIHYDVPPSLEEYYQEAGRAGRDGLPSFAVLLYGATDKGVLRRRITEAFPDRKIVKKTYERICNFLHISVGEGFDSINQFDITKFCKAFNVQERQCRASLRLLSQAGYLQFMEEPDSRSRLKILCEREDLYDVGELSETADKTLSMAMRLYTGLFSDFVYIYEPELATRLSVSESEIYESMLELARKKIISYIPRSDLPMIYFPTSREEISSILIGKEIYESRIADMTERVDAMLGYAEISDSCRVSRMLEYFGEKSPEPCDYCDICRDARKRARDSDKDEDKILSIVVNYLRSRPEGVQYKFIEYNLRQIVPDSTEIAKALSLLCNEGYATFSQGLYRISQE